MHQLQKMHVVIPTSIHDFADYTTMVAIARTCHDLYDHHNAEIDVVQAQFEYDVGTHRLSNIPRDVLEQYDSLFVNRCGTDDMLRYYRERLIEDDDSDPIDSLLYNLVCVNDVVNFKKYAAWIDELAEYVFQKAISQEADES